LDDYPQNRFYIFRINYFQDCLFGLAERADLLNRPAMRIDCGVDDGLLGSNRAFRDHLAKLGIPHEYAEFPGAHSWDYWDAHVQEAIRFHCMELDKLSGTEIRCSADVAVSVTTGPGLR